MYIYEYLISLQNPNDIQSLMNVEMGEDESNKNKNGDDFGSSPSQRPRRRAAAAAANVIRVKYLFASTVIHSIPL